VALLCLAGLGVLVSLVVRPPRNVPSATWRLIIGLVLMFVLAPATRFGYFMYPLGLWAWLVVSQLGARRAQPAGRPDGDTRGRPPPHGGGVAQPSAA
jgi:phosphatidylinositol alpha-1,6-mannosyltransferase